jgi:ribose transport system permease protein
VIVLRDVVELEPKRNRPPRTGPAWLNGKGHQLLNIAQDQATVAILLLLILLFALVDPGTFATWRNFQTIFTTQAVSACVALAALLPLVAGEFDLSLGYNLGFAGIVGAQVGAHGGSALTVVAATLGVGLLIGVVNGLLVVSLRINSFIATLAVGIGLSGISEGVSGGQTLFQGIPQSLLQFGQGTWLTLVYPFWIVIGLVAVFWYLMEWTPFGRQLYAVGGSPSVARLSGIKTGNLKVTAFAIAGVLAALGGLFSLAQTGSANPSYGSSTLLPAYAAVFLGVTAFRRGTYNVRGTAIAVLLVAVGVSGLELLGAPVWIEPVFDGAVLLVAVLTSRAEVRRVESA